LTSLQQSSSIAPLPSVAFLPEQLAQPGMTLAQIGSILWARRKQSIIIALVLIVATAVTAKLLPKTYPATATLMVNYQVNQGGQEWVSLLTSYMSTQIALMRSPVVLLPVVKRLNLTEDREFTEGYRANGGSLRDWVEQNLAEALDIAPAGTSQLVYVTASARDPTKAAHIANAVADVYLEQIHHRDVDPTSDRAKQYSAELEELRAKVTAAQDKVTEFRQRTGITEITNHAQNDIDMQLLSNLEQRLLEAQNMRRVSESQNAVDQSARSSVLGSTLIQNLKAQAAALESQLAQMRATMGDQHPKVIELKSQIDATRRSLDAQIRTYSDNSTAEIGTARGLERKLETAVALQRSKVESLRTLQDEGTKLQLELESAQSVYKRALEDIMFASTVNLTNVNMVSRATPSVKGSKPNKLVIMLVGTVASIFLSLMVPFCHELIFDRRLRCRDDFERNFGVPLLAEFDPIPAAADAA
jgi:succinoglycan biosynthesis transport protein ExoP